MIPLLQTCQPDRRLGSSGGERKDGVGELEVYATDCFTRDAVGDTSYGIARVVGT